MRPARRLAEFRREHLELDKACDGDERGRVYGDAILDRSR